MVAARQQNGGRLATIGTFSASNNDFTSSLKTLTLNVKVTFVATERTTKVPTIHHFPRRFQSGTKSSETLDALENR
jgi:uncharacterized protein (DUF736 family)